jgi:hypothetical protein
VDNLVYEDKAPWFSSTRPWYERYWRSQLYQWRMVPVSVLIFYAGLALAMQFNQDVVIFSILGATGLLMVAAILALLPTKYQIFDDRIRIILGFILHFDIPFSNIADRGAATFGDSFGLKLNFTNVAYSDCILRITRKRGVKVYISPWNRNLFVENLNKATDEWRKYYIEV